MSSNRRADPFLPIAPHFRLDRTLLPVYVRSIARNNPDLFLNVSYMNQRILVLLLLLISGQALAADPDSLRPSGILPIDLAQLDRISPPERPLLPAMPGDSLNLQRKSVWLAGVLSAIVPGAGQYYADAPWWRTALYPAIETAGLITFITFDNKGDKGTSEFQNYADTHWDVTRYVQWIATNYVHWSDQEVDKTAAAEALAEIYRSNDPSLPLGARGFRTASKT